MGFRKVMQKKPFRFVCTDFLVNYLYFSKRYLMARGLPIWMN